MFCGGNNFEVLSRKERNSLPVRTVICKDCGLIFINPRMTVEMYKKYYEEEYRNQMARYKGINRVKHYTNDFLFKRAVKRTQRIINYVGKYVKNGLVVEIGSAEGGVLHVFKETLRFPVLGIEPDPDLVRYSKTKGIETRRAFFEDLKPRDTPRPANIICFRTLNHLLDFRKFLIWANHHLEKDGRLIMDVLDFLQAVRTHQYLPRCIQIDHVFMFTPVTLRHFVAAIGFEVLEPARYSETKEHMYIVARKISDYKPGATNLKNKQIYEQTIKELRQNRNSALLYFLKFGAKRRLLIWLYKFKRAGKKVLVFMGLATPRI